MKPSRNDSDPGSALKQDRACLYHNVDYVEQVTPAVRRKKATTHRSEKPEEARVEESTFCPSPK